MIASGRALSRMRTVGAPSASAGTIHLQGGQREERRLPGGAPRVPRGVFHLFQPV